MNRVEKVKIGPSMTEGTLSAPGNFFSHPLSLHDFEFFLCLQVAIQAVTVCKPDSAIHSAGILFFFTFPLN